MSANRKTYDIAVVGGGMVGLTLALLLAKKRGDWRIALIESHPLVPQSIPSTSSFDARSTALAQGSRGILERCGVWPYLREQLTAIKQVHVSDRGHFAGNLLRAEDFVCEALGYVVENQHLGQALLQVLAQTPGIGIHAPAQVASLQRSRNGWGIALGGPSLHCNLLVLADGATSALGQKLGVSYRIEDYGQYALIANVETDRAHNGIAYERFTECGPIALLPLGHSEYSRRSALVWTLPKERIEELRNLTDDDFLRELQTEFGHRAGRFCRAGSRHAYPLRLAVATEQVRAGLVLMGNAAHSLHPVAGQGFNLALRDCQTLSDILTHSDNPGELATLQAYLQRQSRDQETTIALSHSLVKLFSTNALPSALLRSLGLLGLDAVSPARHLFAQQAMGFPLTGSPR